MPLGFGLRAGRVYVRAPATAVVNGGFDADTAWTKGTGWTIAAGVASKAAGSAALLAQPLPSLIAGVSYQVTYTVSAYVAGTIRVRFTGGSNVLGAVRSANGVYVETLVAVSGNNSISFSADATFAGSIDTVSVVRL